MMERFYYGKVLLPMDEVKYLGCKLNSRADGGKEVKARVRERMTTMKKTGYLFELFPIAR